MSKSENCNKPNSLFPIQLDPVGRTIRLTYVYNFSGVYSKYIFYLNTMEVCMYV